MDTLPHASFNATLDAILNACSAILLLIGFWRIHSNRNKWRVHRTIMLAALLVSAAFLTSYVIYHAHAGSVAYPYHDWTRPIYFAVLIPHVILAVLMTPFIVILVSAALRAHFDRHRKLARWVWPVWMFVSATGVIVYLMLYRPWMG